MPDSRTILLPAVPQTFGEAVALWGEATINCENHEWDNRTTAENAVWLILRLEEQRLELVRLLSDEPRTATLLKPEFQRLWESCLTLMDKAAFKFMSRYLGRVEKKLAAAWAERDALMGLIVQPRIREGDGTQLWSINLAWQDSEFTKAAAIARVRRMARLDPVQEPVQPVGSAGP